MENSAKENIKLYYDNLYSSLEIEMRPMRVYRKVIEYLNGVKGLKLLDVSCRTGNQIKCAEARGIKGYGIEISETAVILARKKAKHGERIVLADALHLPFKDEYFNLITNFASLQYYPDQEKAMSEMARVGRKGARLCIVVPNGNFPLFYIRPQHGCKIYGDKIEGKVLRFYEWIGLFNKNGLIVKKIYKETGPSLTSSKSILQFLRRILLKLSSLLPKEFNYELYFVCEKN
jgi:ubiquinone/menaquinone biosynthesis C-methylase UbiE